MLTQITRIVQKHDYSNKILWVKDIQLLVISNYENEEMLETIAIKVNEMMSNKPLFV